MINRMETPWRWPLALGLGALGGAFIGTALATLYLMVIFREPLSGFDVMRPWFVEHSWAGLGARPAVRQTLALITAIPTVVFALLAVTAMHRGRLTDYDDAHFQSRAEMRRNRMVAGLDRNGFLYGKLTEPKYDGPFVSAEPNRFPHAMMIAPTGRGKGVGFVLPNLLHFQGSAVILDVKGENFATTSIHRMKGLGNRVWYFSPYDYVRGEGEGSPVLTRTHRFNPLARIAAMPSAEQQYTAINTMADLFLIVEAVNAQSFFQAGRSLFVAACLLAIERGKPTIGEALRIMTGGGEKKAAYRRIAQETQNPVVAEVFLSMADQTDKILDSYVSVIRGAGLELWLDPAVDRATSESDFDFAGFRREAQSLYIVVQPEHLATLAPLIRLLFAGAIASLQRALPGPDEPHAVMFLMDEFDQLGRQPLVLQSIKTIRGYGGRYFIISQSVPGLEAIYGETDRRALQAGAGVQVYMTPQDDRTAEVISAALGRRTIVGKSRSQSAVRRLGESANESRRAEERPLISQGEVLRFPLDRVLILPEGQYPIQAHHIRYYEDSRFAAIDQARKGHRLPYPKAVPASSVAPRQMTGIASAAAVDPAAPDGALSLSAQMQAIKAKADAGAALRLPAREQESDRAVAQTP